MSVSLVENVRLCSPVPHPVVLLCSTALAWGSDSAPVMEGLPRDLLCEMRKADVGSRCLSSSCWGCCLRRRQPSPPPAHLQPDTELPRQALPGSDKLELICTPVTVGHKLVVGTSCEFRSHLIAASCGKCDQANWRLRSGGF